MNGLLYSRKFWLAVFGVVTVIVAEYAAIPDSIWVAIEALVITMIGAIAVEDHGAKAGPGPIPGERVGKPRGK